MCDFWHTTQKEFKESNNATTIKPFHFGQVFSALIFLKVKIKGRIDVEPALILEKIIFIHGYIYFLKAPIISLRKIFPIACYFFE